MNEPAPILSSDNLTIGYRHGRRETVVASGLQLSLMPSTVTCLLGANGAGKSTLLRTLCGQQKPLGGTVTVDGLDIHSVKPSALARTISVVYTGHTNVGALTAAEVVALGRQPYTGFFGRLSDDDRAIVDRSIEAVGIRALASRYMATLSDGERQKVMIARALAQRTPVIMLDEPTSFLDVASRLEVTGMLRALADEYRCAILLSTHDIAPALAIADNLWLMCADRKFAAGPADKLIAEGRLDEVFAGRGIMFDPSARDFRIR